MGKALSQINIRFRAELDQFEREMKRAKRDMKTWGDGLKNAGKQMTMYLTAPIALFGAAAINAAGNFEAAMKNVEAITGATGADLEALGKRAKEMGRDTVFSASQAADAMGFLGMAGFETKEIIAAIPEVLNLAAAGNLDLARAADIASNIMGQFGIEADNTARVTNVLAATAASANTNVDQLAEAMQYLGPTANSLGMSLEDTAAIIAVLGDAGIQGSMAGRALATSLVNLTNPTGKIQQAMDALGLSAFDANGNFVGMVEFLRQLESGMEGMTQQQKAANLQMLLGSESFQEINILLERGADAYAEYINGITGTDKAATMAATKMTGWKAVTKEIGSAFEFLQIKIAESGLLEFATNLGKGIANLIRQIADLNPTFLKVATIVGGVVAAIGPLLAGLGFLSSTVLPAAIAGFTTLTAVMLANPIGAVVTALGALAAGYFAVTSVQKEHLSGLAKEQAQLNGLVTAIQGSNDKEEVRASLIDELQSKYPDFLKNLDAEKVTNEQLETALVNANKAYEKRIILQAQEEERMAAYQESAKKLEAIGRARVEASKKLVEASKIEGVELDKNKTVTENLQKAIDDLERKRRNLARGKSETFSFDEFAKTQFALVELQQALQDAEKEYSAQQEIIKALEEEQSRLNDTLFEGNQATDGNTNATNENNEAVQAATLSVGELEDKLKQLKETQKEATNPQQWTAYQSEIDQVQAKIDQIKNGLRAPAAIIPVPDVRGFNEVQPAKRTLKVRTDGYQDQEQFLQNAAESAAQAEDEFAKYGNTIEGVNARVRDLSESLQIAEALYGENSMAVQTLSAQLRQAQQQATNWAAAKQAIMDFTRVLAQSFSTMPERNAEIQSLQDKLKDLKREQKGVSSQEEWNTLQSEIAQTEGQIANLQKQNPFAVFIQYIKQMIAQLLAAIAVAGILSVVLAGLGLGGLFGAGAASIGGIFNGIFKGMSGFDLGVGQPVPMATGAYVTGPTLALVGEGPDDEYVTRAPDMRNLLRQAASMGGGKISIENQIGFNGESFYTGSKVIAAKNDLWRGR